MGYTHYWTFKKPGRGDAAKVEKMYQKAILEIAKIARVYNDTMKADGLDDDRLSGYTAHTKAGQYGGVELNGKGSLAHETFVLREHYSQNFESIYSPGFNFCKTAEKPYDVVVVAALAVLKYRLKDLVDVSSDGGYMNWHKGVELAQKVLKLKIKNPIFEEWKIDQKHEIEMHYE